MMTPQRPCNTWTTESCSPAWEGTNSWVAYQILRRNWQTSSCNFAGGNLPINSWPGVCSKRDLGSSYYVSRWFCCFRQPSAQDGTSRIDPKDGSMLAFQVNTALPSDASHGQRATDSGCRASGTTQKL